MRTYALSWAAYALVLLLTVVLVNVLVDPYGCLHGRRWHGLNRVRPAAGQMGDMAKTCQMRRLAPRTLVLGNSRAEVGLDPASTEWAARPVYNAALPGAGLDTSLRFLQQALDNASRQHRAPVEVVMLGLDFTDFLVDAKSSPSSRMDDDRSTVHGRPRHDPPAGELAAAAARWQELRLSTLTRSALLDSLQTLAYQRDPDAPDLRSDGFNPLHEYRRIAREEGYGNLFWQKDLGNMGAYLSRGHTLQDSSGNSAAAWDDLRQILLLCRQHGIALQVFSYPYHARLLETIRLSGHWQALGEWKQRLVQLLADEAQAAGKPAYVFWDFVAFDPFTTESAPLRGDLAQTTRWYWESGHFKSSLGGLMLRRMLRPGMGPAGLGVQLTPQNQQAQWAALQADEQSYRLGHPRDMEALDQVLAQRLGR